MPVLNEISVGGIIYQEVSGVPTHSATYGVVALDKVSSRIFSYNGSGWELLVRPHYGRIYYSESTVTTDTNATTWVNDVTTSPGTYIEDADMRGFTSSINGELRINSVDNIGRYLISTSTTFQLVANTNYIVESAPIIDRATPTNYINAGLLRLVGNRVSLTSVRIAELLPGNDISLAKRYSAKATGSDNGYAVRNNSIQVYKLEEPIIEYYLNEVWISNTFSTNSWTVVNDDTSPWFVGSGSAYSGSFSAYISGNAGVSNIYTAATTAQVSHFYKDITIPNVIGDIYLSFDWRANGENQAGSTTNYDFGTVHILATTTNPVAGTSLVNTQATILSGGPTGNGRIGATTNLGKFNSGYGGADGFWRAETILLNNYKGQTKRLVFGWQNDESVTNNPPFNLDNIRIYKKIYI
jgi:hypothetical protein